MIRILRLISGEQLVARVQEHKDKKDFLYLHEPLKMEIVPKLSKDFMVEEHIQSQNERIERLQDEMITVQMKLAEHEERFKTRIKIKKSSSSVSGEIKNIFNS